MAEDRQQWPGWTIGGGQLAELLRRSGEWFLCFMHTLQLSTGYLRDARYVIEQYARFCETRAAGHPWQLREEYLSHVTTLHPKGELRQHAKMVTRRHLIWLEQQGRLPVGTASPVGSAPMVRERTELLKRFMARVEVELPHGLREPLVEYLEELVCHRALCKEKVWSALRTNLTLCRKLGKEGRKCFAQLCMHEVDAVVSSLVSAPRDDLLRRRRQVQTQNHNVRGFLRHLYQRGLLERDLAAAVISPPCYRASKPPTVLSEEQIQGLLKSVDRRSAWGRRCYAMLLLLTTYGLRPSDVSRLRLDDVHWREEKIGLIQSKTGLMVTLPLLAEVAAGLQDYLRHDRLPGLRHRQVFVSVNWPHLPVTGEVVSNVVIRAMRKAGLPWGRASHLRSSIATHLLRQGEPLSTIQEILGHRFIETTQRYALTDLELLRQVLEESER